MELIVRDGRFFTIGEQGAEFFSYKRGDIIFNADQTRELFQNGRVLSDGGRGKLTFATGTAFADGAHGGGGFYDTGGSSGNKGGGSGSSAAKKPSGGSSSTSEKKGKEKIDWIEVAIDRIERAIENLAKIAESAFKTLGKRLKANADEIATVMDEIQTQQAGYERYLQEAESVKLSEGIKELVRSGAIDITKYKKKTAELISEYQQWCFHAPIRSNVYGYLI